MQIITQTGLKVHIVLRTRGMRTGMRTDLYAYRIRIQTGMHNSWS